MPTLDPNKYKTKSLDLSSYKVSQPSPTASGLFNEILDSAQQGIQQGVQGIEQINSGQGNPIATGLSGALKVGSSVATTLFSPIAPLMNRTVVPAVNAASNAIASTQPFKSYGKAAAYLPNNEKPLGERILEDLVNAGNTAGGILGAEGLAKAPTQIKDTFSTLSETLTQKSEAQINAAITKNFDKGVKPLINNKTTPTKVAAYNDDVVTAVNSILDNKANLSYVDEFGDAIQGQAPKSLQQLTDALEQTKKSIFTQYDTLAKQAGDAGVTVKTEPIAGELDAVISNKALNLTNPSAVQYARDMQSRYAGAGELDTITTQEVIQNYNKSLEAFYRNPTYDTASKAAIDALIVNKLRQSLDEGVTKMTGESYSALKSQYKALKTIERDVIKASLRNARANVKGLIDFTDILSGGQVVNGILSLNPATVGQGLAAKAIAAFYKHLNDPNRAIQKMFDSASQNQSRGNSLLQAQPAANISTTPATNAIPEAVSQTAPKASLLDKARQLGSFIKDNINDQRGFVRVKGPVDTAKTVTPEAVAQNVNGGDIPAILDYVNDPTLNNLMKLQPVAEAIGIDALDPAQIQAFLQEVISIRNQPNFEFKAQGRRVNGQYDTK